MATASFDAGEVGLGGVKVTLEWDFNRDGFFEPFAWTTTNSSGVYAFGGLPNGSYRVGVDATTVPVGLGPSYDLDGVATPNVAAAALSYGQMTRNDVDFGYRGLGGLGDLVWLDSNANGSFDSGEAGLGGVKVTLEADLNRDGLFETSTSTTTNASGWYAFANLLEGSYRVTVDASTLPAGLAPSYDLDGLATANIATTSLTGAQMTRSDVDFGYRGTGSIGDLVWLDSNANAAADTGEPGLPGVKVTLEMDLNRDGTFEASSSTTTNATGAYAFANLLAGSYRISVDAATLPSGVTSSYDLDGISTPNVAATSLTVAQMTRNDVDFGYRGSGSIGDLVWLDGNANGALDAGETGLPGVGVRLQIDLNSDGTFEASLSTTTSVTGAYGFANLLQGSYRVSIDASTLPGGLAASYDLDGIATLDVAAASLTAAQMNRNDVDFGYRGTGALGDQVWLDTNANGALDAGEAGLSGVKVTLGIDLNRDGAIEQSRSTTTNATGWYTFTNLLEGSYRITVDSSTLPGGVTSTYDLDGTGTPNVTDASLGLAGINSPGAPMTRGDVDFGYRGIGSIGDRVWLDNNGNGALDSAEIGLAGVKVTLGIDLNGDGSFESSTDTTTNATGLYSFTGLLAGNYRLTVDASTLPAGLAPTYDLDGTGTANVSAANLTTAQPTRSDVDFGYRGAGSLGDQVWLDSNGNNTFDPIVGEIGLAGVKVTLQMDFNRDGVFESSSSTTTNGTGGYSFSNLPAASYRVSVDPATLPAGLSASYDLDGAATANVTNASLTGGQMTRSDVDFAYQKAKPPSGRTPGYWKNHAEAWPVAGVTLGGKYYDKAAAIAIMNAPTKTDVTYSMAQGLIAAKLNVGDGVPAQNVSATIQQADDWIRANPIGSGVKGGGKDSTWRTGEPLYQMLDKFNNGR